MNITSRNIFSHLFSLSAINLIIGWGGGFYIIKIFFFFLIGFLSLIAIAEKKRFYLNKLIFILFVSVLISFIYHYNIFNGELLSKDAINFLKKILLPVIFGMFVYNAAIFVKLLIFVKYLKVFMLLSITFIGMQYFNFWSINLLFFSNEVVERVQGGGTYLGISSSAFYMGSQLAIITPIIIAYSSKQKVLNIFFILFSFFSGQRAYFLTRTIDWLKNKINIKVILLILLILFPASVYIMFSELSSSIFRGYDSDRIVIYFAGINYLLENPFGAGGLYQYAQAIELASENNDFLSEYITLIALVPAPHNIFINSAVIHGALFLLPLSYVVYKIYKLDNIFSWGFLFGVFVALFHNLSFIYADFFSWIILAFALRYKEMKKSNYVK
jgi:hypothetical protein